MAAIEVHRVARPKRHARANVPPSHRLLLRPIAADGTTPTASIDMTDGVVRAVAHELWQLNHGNETLNWLEAERLVQHLLDLAWASQRGSQSQSMLPHQEIEVTPDRREQSELLPLPISIDERELSLAA